MGCPASTYLDEQCVLDSGPTLLTSCRGERRLRTPTTFVFNSCLQPHTEGTLGARTIAERAQAGKDIRASAKEQNERWQTSTPCETHSDTEQQHAPPCEEGSIPKHVQPASALLLSTASTQEWLAGRAMS